jgi:hypothetical protein
MIDGIPKAEENVLSRTGDIFLFSYPETYAKTVEKFLKRHNIETESGHN